MAFLDDAAESRCGLSLGITIMNAKTTPKIAAEAPVPSLRYKQGESGIVGVEHPIKLSSNESSHGPSPAAIDAFSSCSTQLHRYPDGSQRQLREAISAVYGLNADQLICGNGSDELISLTVRAFVRSGDHALLSENGFIMSNIHCQTQHAVLDIAPETQHRVCVDSLLARVGPRTRFCTIANPNNPTGTYIPLSELRRLREGLPDDCVLLVDSAYAEYVDEADYDPGIALVNEYDNVIMTRTFSKIHGLSALRVGWAYASERIISVLQSIRTPFNVNAPALAAAAAAMRDTDWAEKVKQHNNQSLAIISDRIRGLGIDIVPSVANFYLMRFSGEN
ncbi:MAG: histidinol-phosphate transaminase, partial [Pseudomonadales bacterium]